MNTTKASLVLILLVVLAFACYNVAFAHPKVTLSLATPSPITSHVVQHSVARPLYSASHSHSIVGPPTVTASFINLVLAAAHSPAVGIGNVMYTLGVKYGIDPAFPLAFYHHESGYGEHGMARTTLSIGNIRCTVGYACDPTGGYRAYSSYKAGVQDWYQLMIEVYLPNGLTTVEKIIPVYAPTKDNNNESAYISSVLADVAAYRRGEVVA